MAVWGFSFVAIRIALDYVNPGQLVVLRFLPVLLIFGPVAFYRLKRNKTSLNLKDLLWLTILGLFAVIGYNISLNTGQTKIPASLAALVIALNPTSIAIFASLTLKEKVALRTWIGLIIGLVGISVVVLGREMPSDLRLITISGVLITMGAPLSYGIYTVGLRYYTPRIGAITSTAATMSLGSIPLLFMINRPLVETTIHAPPPLVWSVLFLAIVCTIIAFTFWAKVVSRIEASRAGIFNYLVPLVAAFGSRLILDEPIDLPLITGAAIVLFGVATASGYIIRNKKPNL